MRSVSAQFHALLESDTLFDVVSLVEIAAPTPIYRAMDWPRDVTFGGNTYTADAGAHSEITSGITGRRPGMILTLQNVEDATNLGTALPWSTYLAANDLNGAEVTFRLVAEQFVADADAVLQESRWFVSGWETRKGAVKFKLGSPHDALALKVPAQPLVCSTCHWAATSYQQGPCTSTSPLATCSGTLLDCKARFPSGAILPFGPSFPFVTRARRRR